jgi:ADP-heptose:LPS heptosyltransferase
MHHDEEKTHARVGWNLPDLAWRYGLKAGEDVRWRERFFTEEDMVSQVHAAADVVLSTSAGEGFQYPLWEALACGRRVVAPNDSARRAWLSSTPGVYLYQADRHGEVVRGGYNRRMSRPDISDACRIIKKMIEGKQKHQECSEASRAWVGRTASVDKIKSWWVDHIDELVRDLETERVDQGFTVHGEPDTDHVIALRQAPGLGDFLMMLPALEAFVRLHPGDTTCLALPRSDPHVELAQLFSPCDLLQMELRIPLDRLGSRFVNLSQMWQPRHQCGWSDPAIHRTDAVADFMEVPRSELRKLPMIPAERHVKEAKAHFVQRYGVHPTSCVAICAQSHNPARSLPEAYVLTVAERIINLGLTPILVGGQQTPCARVGILNLCGQTDLGGVIGVLGSVGAAICIDSGPLHIAAIQGTPLVALMPLFAGHTRLKYYSGEIEVVEPECTELVGETYPAGKDGSEAWVSELTPPRIMAALTRLLEQDEEEGPKLLTAEDLKQ